LAESSSGRFFRQTRRFDSELGLFLASVPIGSTDKIQHLLWIRGP
jgi:hypothetical protein